MACPDMVEGVDIMGEAEMEEEVVVLIVDVVTTMLD